MRLNWIISRKWLSTRSILILCDPHFQTAYDFVVIWVGSGHDHQIIYLASSYYGDQMTEYTWFRNTQHMPNSETNDARFEVKVQQRIGY